MLMHKVLSTHGRLIPKPEIKSNTEEEILEEPSTIQDQIENLRTKISLKERYTKVLEEEIEESHEGAATVLQDLYYETRDLRTSLMEALGTEKKAVQNAMRTHREFQLAMTDRPPTIAIPWLEDKLFDVTKRFNRVLCTLFRKRRQLEDSERMVCMLEKYPVPGSLPWEVDALKQFFEIETKISNIRIKRETALILYTKYKEIKFVLREEKGKYLPTLQQYENQLRLQKKELQSLNKMLFDANAFRDEAFKNLIATEKEASENRKIRRQQMAKTKKAVENAIAENHMNRFARLPPNPSKTDVTVNHWEDEKIDFGEVERILVQKNLELAEFEARAQRIVEIMRVNDLTQIPRRYRTVRALAAHLRKEQEAKEAVLSNLINHRDQLVLILSHFRYTGAIQLDGQKKKVQKFDEAINGIDLWIAKNGSEESEHGNAIVDLRLTLLALSARLDGTAIGSKIARKVGIHEQIKTLTHKSKKLVKVVNEYDKIFEDKEADRNYASYAKPPPTQFRLLRVGAFVEDSETEDDDVPDSHVPARLDIKARNQRFKQQAILKRGLK